MEYASAAQTLTIRGGMLVEILRRRKQTQAGGEDQKGRDRSSREISDSGAQSIFAVFVWISQIKLAGAKVFQQ